MILRDHSTWSIFTIIQLTIVCLRFAWGELLVLEWWGISLLLYNYCSFLIVCLWLWQSKQSLCPDRGGSVSTKTSRRDNLIKNILLIYRIQTALFTMLPLLCSYFVLRQPTPNWGALTLWIIILSVHVFGFIAQIVHWFCPSENIFFSQSFDKQGSKNEGPMIQSDLISNQVISPKPGTSIQRRIVFQFQEKCSCPDIIFPPAMKKLVIQSGPETFQWNLNTDIAINEEINENHPLWQVYLAGELKLNEKHNLLVELQLFSDKSSTLETRNVNTCQLCLASIESANIVTILECGHLFHRSCCIEWLLKARLQCPQCQAKLGEIVEPLEEEECEEGDEKEEQ